MDGGDHGRARWACADHDIGRHQLDRLDPALAPGWLAVRMAVYGATGSFPLRQRGRGTSSAAGLHGRAYGRDHRVRHAVRRPKRYSVGLDYASGQMNFSAVPPAGEGSRVPSMLAASVALLRSQVPSADTSGWSKLTINGPAGMPVIGGSLTKLVDPVAAPGVAASDGLMYPHMAAHP